MDNLNSSFRNSKFVLKSNKTSSLWEWSLALVPKFFPQVGHKKAMADLPNVKIRLTNNSIWFSKVKIMWKGKWRITETEKKNSLVVKLADGNTGIRIAKGAMELCHTGGRI